MKRTLIVVLISAVMWIGTPAYASCAAPPDLETAFAEADLVFVGIVTEVSNNGRTAQVEVEQIWKGDDQPFDVVVHGGPRKSDLLTSVDRMFELGVYLFFPTNTEPPFEDNACTLTQRFNQSLDVINPFGEESSDEISVEGGSGGSEFSTQTEAGSSEPAAFQGDDADTQSRGLGLLDDQPESADARLPFVVLGLVAVLGAGFLVVRSP